jgi:hypothetical protein
LALFGTLWRLWQLLKKDVPESGWRRWMRIGLTLLHLLLGGYLVTLIGRCIWPYHCGEGFAAGFAAGAVGVMGAIWAILWLISEGLMLLVRPATEKIEEH